MNTSNRPAIPSELRRRILVDAGHRCAIPTCRHIDVDVHHIIPYEKCQKHEYENLIALCPNCHRRADKNEIDRKSLRMYKANLQFTIEKYSQFEADTLFELYKHPPNAGLTFPKYLFLLIKRLHDAGYVEYRELSGIMIDRKAKGIVKITPDLLLITKAGRDFIDSLSTSNIGY